MNEQEGHARADDYKEIRSDIRELDRWLIRIDEKLNGLDRIEKKADDAHALADKADDTANAALKAGEVLETQFESYKSSTKWVAGLIVSVLVPTAIFVANIAF